MSDYDWKKIAKIVIALIVVYVLYTLLFNSSSSDKSDVVVSSSAPTQAVGKKELFDALNSTVDVEDAEYDLTSQGNGQYGLYGPLHTYEMSFDDKASVSDSQLILEQVLPTLQPTAELGSRPVATTMAPAAAVASVAAVAPVAPVASVAPASSLVPDVLVKASSSVDTYINDNQQKLSSFFDTVKSSLADSK
jgi:hypothetical protein